MLGPQCKQRFARELADVIARQALDVQQRSREKDCFDSLAQLREDSSRGQRRRDDQGDVDFGVMAVPGASLGYRGV